MRGAKDHDYDSPEGASELRRVRHIFAAHTFLTKEGIKDRPDSVEAYEKEVGPGGVGEV